VIGLLFILKFISFFFFQVCIWSMYLLFMCCWFSPCITCPWIIFTLVLIFWIFCPGGGTGCGECMKERWEGEGSRKGRKGHHWKAVFECFISNNLTFYFPLPFFER
jgi:hypothetical protein